MVQNVNDHPRCDLARASKTVLWPPKHKLIPVRILGVTDPDHDKVTITVTAVTQDEPVNGLGDGDTSPDAVLHGHKVLLRAERSGTGNGRVYTVHLTAVDKQGGACTGTVTVGVPHSMKRGESSSTTASSTTRPRFHLIFHDRPGGTASAEPPSALVVSRPQSQRTTTDNSPCSLRMGRTVI